MKIITDNLHRAVATHLRLRAVDALSHHPGEFHRAMLRAKLHDLARRNPRAARVMFKLLPVQMSPAGVARIRAMLPCL